MVDHVLEKCPDYITNKGFTPSEFRRFFKKFLNSDGTVSESSIILMRKHESLNDTIYEVIDIITLACPELNNINNGASRKVYDPSKTKTKK